MRASIMVMAMWMDVALEVVAISTHIALEVAAMCRYVDLEVVVMCMHVWMLVALEVVTPRMSDPIDINTYSTYSRATGSLRDFERNKVRLVHIFWLSKGAGLKTGRSGS
jgi:hypothetical protein